MLQSLQTACLFILKSSGLQFFGSLGVLFLSGMLLSRFSKWTGNSFQQFVFPRFGLYFFGVIGIPIHEFSHAFFAKIFFHRIQKIKWFDPKGANGAYGSVTHYYEPGNLYHRIGMFFIGMGPVILAPAVLLALYFFLVPAANPLMLSGFNQPSHLLENFAQSLVASQNFHSIKFYLFIYFAICLTSQMELSSADLKIARAGSLPFLLFLIVINSVTYFFQYNWQGKFISVFNSGLMLWGACLLIASLIALVNLFFCWAALSLIHLLCGRESINPFHDHS